MADFSFLKSFITSEGLDDEDLNHCLYPLDLSDIEGVDFSIKIPFELKRFYEDIGYGFFHRKTKTGINRLLDPDSFREINLREGFYEFDPDLEIYNDLYHGDKLLFFEVNEGSYLAIDKSDKDNCNAIYYFSDKIANSLKEFLLDFDKNPSLLM